MVVTALQPCNTLKIFAVCTLLAVSASDRVSQVVGGPCFLSCGFNTPEWVSTLKLLVE